MQLTFGKHCDLMIYRWHSINLIPAIGVYNVASDSKTDPVTGCKGWDGTIVGRSIEITFFGLIINFMYPTQKYGRQIHSKLCGPLWSIKRKRWYRAPD